MGKLADEERNLFSCPSPGGIGEVVIVMEEIAAVNPYKMGGGLTYTAYLRGGDWVGIGHEDGIRLIGELKNLSNMRRAREI